MVPLTRRRRAETPPRPPPHCRPRRRHPTRPKGAVGLSPPRRPHRGSGRQFVSHTRCARLARGPRGRGAVLAAGGARRGARGGGGERAGSGGGGRAAEREFGGGGGARAVRGGGVVGGSGDGAERGLGAAQPPPRPAGPRLARAPPPLPPTAKRALRRGSGRGTNGARRHLAQPPRRPRGAVGPAEAGCGPPSAVARHRFQGGAVAGGDATADVFLRRHSTVAATPCGGSLGGSSL
mmetsp:Transcript_35237/g.62852  ORF Transcript_35237/g.62852 Transcript_35237/m.62852 type:complete len:236 (-) Transcript_35237:127-834(-)